MEYILLVLGISHNSIIDHQKISVDSTNRSSKLIGSCGLVHNLQVKNEGDYKSSLHEVYYALTGFCPEISEWWMENMRSGGQNEPFLQEWWMKVTFCTKTIHFLIEMTNGVLVIF